MWLKSSLLSIDNNAFWFDSLIYCRSLLKIIESYKLGASPPPYRLIVLGAGLETL